MQNLTYVGPPRQVCQNTMPIQYAKKIRVNVEAKCSRERMNSEEEKKQNNAIAFVMQCVGFWNVEGAQVHQMNCERRLGTPTTQEMAIRLPFDSWMLEMLIIDIRAHIAESYAGWKAGRAGSHIWISDAKTNERIFFITVN